MSWTCTARSLGGTLLAPGKTKWIVAASIVLNLLVAPPVAESASRATLKQEIFRHVTFPSVVTTVMLGVKQTAEQETAATALIAGVKLLLDKQQATFEESLVPMLAGKNRTQRQAIYKLAVASYLGGAAYQDGNKGIRLFLDDDLLGHISQVGW